MEFIPVFDDNTLAVRASGKLTHEDYQEFLPKLEQQIQELDKLCLLIEFDNFSGWDLTAAKDDFIFGMKHLGDFERIALVGDKAWENWMALMAKPFMPSGTIRYFDRENLQNAWDWLREKQELEKKAEQLNPYKKIVVAVDFTLYSKHACIRAFELANFYQASVTLLNVTPYYPYGNAFGDYYVDMELLEEENKQFIEAAESQMKKFIESLDTKLSLTSKVISGDKNSRIVSFIEAQNTDLIVFGAKKKKGISKLMSSTASYVQSHNRCETLIVPVYAPAF